MIKNKYTIVAGEIAKVDGGYVLRFTAYPRSYERDAEYRERRNYCEGTMRAHWECACKTWDQACKRLREFMDEEEEALHGSSHE